MSTTVSPNAVFLWVGLVAWALVVVDFVWCLKRRHNGIRLVWVVASIGWCVLYLRELRRLPASWTWPIVIVGMIAGLASAVFLIARWMNNPRVMD